MTSFVNRNKEKVEELLIQVYGENYTEDDKECFYSMLNSVTDKEYIIKTIIYEEIYGKFIVDVKHGLKTEEPSELVLH
uniref:Uncharacterized protein n=1 Tax=Acrobeloides nanus TaxID=290746 RepID=A0A914D972_9BILA